MSKLETNCKELILDLAKAQRHVRALTDREALLLARWTAKTAFALHSSSNWRKVVPDDHISKLDLDSYRLPKGVFVVAHSFNASRSFSWTQTTSWEIRSRGCNLSDNDLKALEARGYKIAFRIGGLFLMICHNPLRHADVCLWKRKHIPLYPRWSHPVAWKITKQSWPPKADFRFHVFVHSLGITMDASARRISQSP
jgi:hypothetical protein